MSTSIINVENAAQVWLGSAFAELTGHQPFPWQGRMFDSLLRGEMPEHVDIATGLGKTSVIHLWLLALAWSLEHGTATLSRRLVYVVNRRTVVDQATAEVETIRERLAAAKEGSVLAKVGETLTRTACRAGEPLAISTLRGQFADNQQWSTDPSRASVIVGTVDMVGSRLLFSGYGSGRYRRPLHAGLLAHSLFIFDEVHLEPSFAELLRAIRDHQAALKPLFLSATLRPHPNAFLLTEADVQNAEIARRLNAKKTLRLVRGPVEQIVTEAAKLKGGVVIFVDMVKMVEQITDELRKQLPAKLRNRVLAVTGEMRGRERDNMTQHPVWSAFAPVRKTDTPAWLVATSCLEVGVNFDADHMVCTLAAMERMIQRLGRVNRFGNGDAQVVVVLDGNEIDPILQATIEALTHLPAVGREQYDASPHALMRLKQEFPDLMAAAFTPDPPCPPLDAARLDDWSMTSLSAEDYPRPQVSYWLHGLVPDKTLYTWFCWRADLDYANSAESAVEMAQAIPAAPREIAQVNTLARGAELIRKIAENHGDKWVVTLSQDGEWYARTFTELAADKNLALRLFFATVYLPAGVGGLLEGQTSPSPAALRTPASDVVSDDWVRLVVRDTGEVAHLMNGELVGEDGMRTVKAFCRSVRAKLVYMSEGEPRVAYLERAQIEPEGDVGSGLADRKVSLKEHLATAKDVATRLTRAVGVTPDLADAIIKACEYHDLGKNREWWQAAIGNTEGEPLAKSDTPSFDYAVNKGYRHEFGSMLEVAALPSLAEHPYRDLILHLIAAHHGWARPEFRPQAYDRSQPIWVCQQAAKEAALRFARLQSSFGWWELAYLEALVKCVDIQGVPGAQRVNLDTNPTNPINYLACCGIFELLSRFENSATAHWEVQPPRFVMQTSISEQNLVNALSRAVSSDQALSHSATLMAETLHGDGTINKRSAWKMYAGNQTLERLCADMVGACDDTDKRTLRDLLTFSVKMTGRFGFDPRSSRNALDTGYSANDLSISIPTYPFAELLALVGAASFFPSRLARPGELQSTRGWGGKYPKGFHYVAWANPLPVTLARIAATRGEGVRLFSRKANRDKYSNLTFAVIDDRGISNGGAE